MNPGSEVADHPRPLRRRAWQSLEGPWDFAMESRAVWIRSDQVAWGAPIQVPFAPETQASGIHDPGYHEVCWYRRSVEIHPPAAGERVLLHFNAVDYAARVWVGDHEVARHEGGYTPFTADLTDRVQGDPVTIVVRAHDDPFDLAKPRGKQDWQLQPHSIWYPRTSGIWQTVWLERVPGTWIHKLRWLPNLECWEIGLEVRLAGRQRDDLRLRVELSTGGAPLARDMYGVLSPDITRRIALSDPGIDDYRNTLLWSPHSPTLIDATLELLDGRDQVIDRVESYTALRSIAVQGHTVVLNGRPYPLRMVLDQGYWPESGMTAPDTTALKRDVELTKAMGFNGVRKHQKLEDPRYLHWADVLGLLVWVEMPSAYRFTTVAVRRVTKQWMEAVRRDFSHPCVVVWVPFNESWGVPNLPEIPAQRNFVQSLYHLTHTLDPTRLVIGNDGWESSATDIVGIHDYDENPDALAARYRMHENLTNVFRRERPGGRMLTLEGYPHPDQPVMLTEFGGIALCDRPDRCWGYSMAGSSEELAQRYEALLKVVRNMPALAGFCYTQFTDTYQEANGLLYADRTPKFPLERIAQATRGPRVKRMTPTSSQAPTLPAGPAPPHDAQAP